MEADLLFLFAPLNWSWCGGATLICAPSLDEAIAIGNVGGNEIAEGGTFVAGDVGEDCWGFVEVFQLATPRCTGVIFSDANYA